MSDRRDRSVPIAHADLEALLADLATAVAFPPTPDLATTVGSRLRAPLPRPRVIGRSVSRSLLLAAALALLVVGGALAVRFGLELLSIEFGPVPSLAPSPSPPAPGPSPSLDATPEPLGAALRLGRLVTLDEAIEGAAFDVLVPATLGPPDVAYLGGAELRGQVGFVYAPRDGMPLSGLLRGAGLLITQNRGEPDAGLARKLIDSGQATVTSVDVDGAPGVWISGEPHFFWYIAPDGAIIEDSRRFVGDTLAWERDGVLYRIEGDVTLEFALEIARSLQ